MKAIRVIAFVLTCALTGCHDEPSPPSTKTIDLIQPLPPEWIEDTSTDPATTAAKKALLAEPKIKGIFVVASVHQRSWRVAVDDDGTDRRGYAEYVCLVLREHKVPQLSEVRVVVPGVLRDINSKSRALGFTPCDSDRQEASSRGDSN